MFFLCNKCGLGVRIVGDLTESTTLLIKHPKWRDSRPCIRTGCGGEMELQGKFDYEDAVQEDHTLEVHEFFRALCGFGTPDEIASEPEIVRSLLKSEKIVDVKVRKSYTRTVVDHIDLANGLRLHFTLGSEGAVVYKITRYRDDPVDDDQGGVHPDSEDSGVQRCDGGDGSDEGGGRHQRGAPLRSFLTYKFHGGDHQGSPPNTSGVSGSGGGDGSPNEEHEADAAGE